MFYFLHVECELSLPWALAPLAMPSWFPRKDTSPQTTSDTVPITTRLQTRYNETAVNYCLVFALGAASGVGAVLAWRRWGMRLLTAEWVTPNELARRRWIRGVVTR